MTMTTQVRKIKLVSGGYLVMSIEDAHPFAWSGHEREFFFGLIDAMFAYEEKFRQDENLAAKRMFDQIREALELDKAADAVDLSVPDAGPSVSQPIREPRA